MFRRFCSLAMSIALSSMLLLLLFVLIWVSIDFEKVDASYRPQEDVSLTNNVNENQGRSFEAPEVFDVGARAYTKCLDEQIEAQRDVSPELKDYSKCDELLNDNDASSVVQGDLPTSHPTGSLDIIEDIHMLVVYKAVTLFVPVMFDSFFSFLVFFGIFFCNATLIFLCLSNQAQHGSAQYTQWSIDTPPILGIVGTLFAMMSFFTTNTNAGGFSIDEFFSQFSIAALSTLYGGLTSVFNHFLVSHFRIE